MRSAIRYVGMGCLALLTLACGDKGDDGTPGAGGTAGSAGAAGGGGTAGTSEVDAGGTGGTAGAGGSAADSGSADSGRVITQSYNFDTDVQMWKVTYTDALKPAGDSGITAVPIGDIMVTHDPARGSPTPGTLQAAIPYSSRSQYVGVGISFATDTDLTGKIITAKVQVASGLGTAADLMTNPGGAKLYVKSGAGFVYAAGTFNNLSTTGNWIDIDFDLDFTRSPPSYVDTTNPAGMFDPKAVRELGIQFDTGGMSTTASPAVVLIDSVAY